MSRVVEAEAFYDPPTRTLTVRARQADGNSFRLGDATEAMWLRGAIAPRSIWLFARPDVGGRASKSSRPGGRGQQQEAA